ncbi:MAG: hypothetical protein PWP65_1546 [Clostridia bacterium]|nr:hypothetical protein [Clostridia bacterium]
MQNLTLQLAENILSTDFDRLPPEVVREARRGFFNWLGVAIGACRHETIDILISMAGFAGAKEQASVLGREEKTNIFFAALINGTSSHTFDFDDTHLDTILHPSAPVAPAALAVGEYYGLSGKEVLAAYALGVEVACRVAVAICPSHYSLGWHVTGTAGVLGAAAAAGKLLGLDARKMAYALGIAAAQPVGLREMFGTMTKPFHPGKAAMNGLMSAWLAKEGFTSSERALEAPAGYLKVMAPEYDAAKINSGWGERFEILANSYKPYACGVVAHPVITGVVALREKYNLKPEDVAGIEAQVNHWVLKLMGKESPQTGLEAKFSTYHCAAVGLIYGRAGERQFSDEVVKDERTVALRKKVKLITDEKMREDEARVRIILNDGRVLEEYVGHAKGSRENPMTDKELEDKYRDLVAGILPPAKIEDSVRLAWDMENLADVRDLVRACCP